jgi:(1->4)-alpha-D-glucan 1-alpha-D-glucosylmutase
MPGGEPLRRPLSTYRVQLHRGFGFSDAARITGYLSEMGVSHMYCSPYLQAVTGSMHGYDIVDFHRLNEELGGEAAYAELPEALDAHNLGQVADIVPNHMAAAGRANQWWWDVLENGPSSRYAKYFDIDWQGPDESGRETVLAPILEDHYGRMVDNQELKVEWRDGSFLVRYHEHELPLSPRTLDGILGPAAERLPSAALAELARAFAGLPHARRHDWASSVERHRRKEVLFQRLELLCAEDPVVGPAIETEVNLINRDPDRLDLLLRRQNYRLAYWRTAAEELDYRRFFNIETLVGLREELAPVFSDVHRVWLGLISSGSVQGLRVDHVDGLRDPTQYLTRLSSGSGGAYTVVEKILEPSERLPEDWPVDGTTGYDFLNRVNNLFVDTEEEAAVTQCYQTFTGEKSSYEEIVVAAKRQVLTEELASEAGRLSRALLRVANAHRRHRDRTGREVQEAVEEMLVAFPPYRTYVRPGRQPADADRTAVATAVRRATGRRSDVDPELLSFIGELLLQQHQGPDEVEFALRFAQVSAPVTAKGVEDTAFYRYNRLISLNEVGGAPEVFGRTLAQFHADTLRMAEGWPGTMLTLSTHDTKRSADVRARINLISELPEAWRDCVERLAGINDGRREKWPDRSAEYLFYQTAVGAWPIDAERTDAFMTKATREAKLHTSWMDPVSEYDEAVSAFVRGALADRRFVQELEGFLSANRLVELGRLNSLAQMTLLLTCPGVPDIYQGSELWDLSLVDPDNRRPVDYQLRRRLLASVPDGPPEIPIRDDAHGIWKLWLTHRLLAHRRHHVELYESGEYEPLEVMGPKDRHVVAFGRGDLAVVLPRLIARHGDDNWPGRVTIGSGSWKNVLTGVRVSGGQVPLSELLAGCPVAVLTRGDR